MPDKIVNHFVLADGSVARYDYDGLLNAPATTYNVKRWWQLNDPVFNGLTQANKNALMHISKFDVHVYGNASMQMYQVSVGSDGAFSLAIRFVSPEGTTTTYPVTLPAVLAYTETTYHRDFFDIDIGYTTQTDVTGSLVGSTANINLETNRKYNLLTDSAGFIDARLIPKVELAKNITKLTVNRIRNRATETNKYYAFFTATLDNGDVITADIRNTTLQTGIVKNEVAGSTVYVDADVLFGYYSRLDSSHEFDIDVMYCDVFNATNYTHIENNLTSDGSANLLNCEFVKNGVSSQDNYGEDGTQYKFTFDAQRKLHIYFEYQLTDVPTRATDSDYMTICTVYGGITRADIYLRGITTYYTSEIWENYVLTNFAGGYGNTSSSLGNNNHIFNGKTAFVVKYTGSETSDVTLDFSNGSVSLSHAGAVLESASYNGTDTVDSLISSLNGFTDLECTGVETTGKTCAELLVSHENASIPLVYTYTANNVTSTDSGTVNIPYALNLDWHSCEIVVDWDSLASYVAIDGRTIRATIKPSWNTQNKTIVIGGTYLGADAPIRTRNLVIDYDGFGDAETVTSYVPPYTDGLPQIISCHNPKLLIFEGHGVDVGTDVNAPYSDDMAVTTDRLMVLFETLTAKGYVPITWQDVIEWKINNKKLPKRCYVLMMDDWRYENYVDYYKRQPFEKYNVKAGIAVISDRYEMSDTFTVNGVTYTAEEMTNIVNLAGWYACSHTKEHRRLTDFSNSELVNLFKEDILSCNKHNIHSDIVVYPYGAYNNRMRGVIDNTPFKLGVMIVENNYPCKLSDNYRLPRVEIGTRESLENVLMPIV